MLSPELKETIQNAYRRIIESKDLKPRWGQRLMIAEIAKTLGEIKMDAEGKRTSAAPFCVVEAGTGTGNEVDWGQAVPLHPGSYMMHPGGAVHWDGAMDEDVVVEIKGMGPAPSIPAGQ